MSEETPANGLSSVQGAVRHALTTRDAFQRRIAKSRPIVSVHIPELDDPEDTEQPEAWVLMRAMTGTAKEDWQWRRIAEDHYEPDQDLAREMDRRKTWGEVLKGNKQSLVAESVVDESGRQLWSQHDVAELAEANSAALERLYAKSVQLNGMPRNSVADYLIKWLEADEAGSRAVSPATADIAKNSPGGRTKGSSSS